MTEAWKADQLRWLAEAHEVRRRELESDLRFEEYPDPAPSQVALLQIFTDTLTQKISPETAASRITKWVLSVGNTDKCYDIHTAYSNIPGVLLAGARQLSSQEQLKALAGLTIELANLPDLYNNRDQPLNFEAGSIVIKPGEKVCLPCQTGSTLWSTLPDFAQHISVALVYGPRQYFSTLEPGAGEDARQSVHCEAEQTYTNINTYAALIARQHLQPGSPLISCLHSAFGVFALLEHAPDTPRGDFAHLAVQAAASWLTVAGKELIELGSPSTKHDYNSGSLWAAEGGASTVDIERLQFWKRMFRVLRESGRLVSQEAVEATHEAEMRLDSLMATL